jgi:excisionase family DNA binding protein
MSEHDSTEWLDVRQVAAKLHTTTRTVSRLCKTGRLPAVRLSEHEGWRIRAVDLDKLVPTERKDEAQA